MPVTESPSYHGYDVVDSYRINPDYGTRADFKRLIAEAHRRGIRVLVDLVPNHVSNRHPAFQAALRDSASPYRSWFRFSPKPGGRNRWGGDNWHRSPFRDEFYYELPASAASLIIADRVHARRKSIATADSVQVRLRGVGGGQVVHLTLVEDDGTSLERGYFGRQRLARAGAAAVGFHPRPKRSAAAGVPRRMELQVEWVTLRFGR